jgi:pimeloyl-ACP methyl ester carboxylesterase
MLNVRRREALAIVAPVLAGGATACSRWPLGRPAPDPAAPPVLRRVEATEGNGYRNVTLSTDRGAVDGRHFASDSARTGVLWLPGATREWHSPAKGLYARLGTQLAGMGVTSVWLRYRSLANPEETIFDARVGLAYLRSLGVATTAIVGHSFGGSVAIQAAVREQGAYIFSTQPGQGVRTVVALAGQGEGTAAVWQLAPRCALLLAHGTANTIVPPVNAQEVFRRARDPKRLVLYPGADHSLDSAADRVTALVTGWLSERLA